MTEQEEVAELLCYIENHVMAVSSDCYDQGV